MNKLHCICLWILYPGVIFGWFMMIFPFLLMEFILLTVKPIFQKDMKDFRDGTKRKWSEK